MKSKTNTNISYLNYSNSACGISYSNNSAKSDSMINIIRNNCIIVDRNCIGRSSKMSCDNNINSK